MTTRSLNWSSGLKIIKTLSVHGSEIIELGQLRHIKTSPVHGSGVIGIKTSRRGNRRFIIIAASLRSAAAAASRRKFYGQWLKVTKLWLE